MTSPPPLAIDIEVLGGADVEREQIEICAPEGDAAGAVGMGIDGELVAGGIVAVDLDGVETGAAFHEVRAVAVVPDEQVGAFLAEHDVVAAIAEDGVVAGAAPEDVDAVATDEQVVALAAVEVEADEAVEADGADDDVGAALAIDVEVLGGADVECDQLEVVSLEADALAVG